MRNSVETIGNLIDKQSISFISYVDENGYPNKKLFPIYGSQALEKKVNKLFSIF